MATLSFLFFRYGTIAVPYMEHSSSPQSVRAHLRARYREFAVRTAREAGGLLMELHRRTHHRTWKTATDFKTNADDASDRLIRQRITKTFPDHHIMSEEQTVVPSTAAWVWVVDPLDGTYNFASLWSDDFTVSIGLLSGAEPVVGVVYAPARRQLYVAELGGRARLDGKPIRVSDVANLSRAVVALDYGKGERRGEMIPYLRRLLSADGITYPVTYACASLAIARVAAGQVDAYVSHNLEPWDMAAAVMIVRAAGGIVTNLAGQAWHVGDASILAASSQLHRQLLTFLHDR